MRMIYPVVYRRNATGKVTDFYFPDLDFKKDISDQEVEPKNLEEYVSKTLLARLNFLKDQNVEIPRPKKLADHKKITTNSNDFWTKSQVDFDLKRGPFERFLPKFGLFSALVTALTMALISFTAIEVSSGGGAAGLTFGIVGVFCTTLMAVIIYHYSNAGNVSRKLGKVVDDTATRLSNCRRSINRLANQPTLNRHSTPTIL